MNIYCFDDIPEHLHKFFRPAPQIGLEQTPDEYVGRLVEVFREVRRVLRDDGTCFLNLGDSYANTGNADNSKVGGFTGQRIRNNAKDIMDSRPRSIPDGLKPKDLVGIPWRVAFALQADGWWLRQDIIWCLSGGTWVYARTQKGDMPMTVKDMARLDPSTVKLWNGEKWTQLLGMNVSERRGDELELVLRSGERISCTPTHKFPTSRGVIEAGAIVVGDVLETCVLPEPEQPRDCAIDEDAAWFAGLYIAEGSRRKGKMSISGHAREVERWEKCERIARKFGGSATLTVNGNNQTIRLYGNVINAIIDELVTGNGAKGKGFAPVVWRYSNKFIDAMLDGYLSGDGHWDEGNARWRIGFARNYNLERDLRTACARLGYRLTLNMSRVAYNGTTVPTFRGEIRKHRSGHHNERNMGEVVEIRKARCRQVYDLGVADEPHLFSLASGVLTHNSKPNPMPESVRDRCTKAHEYVFLLTKSARYFYDAAAVAEPATVGFNGSSFISDYDRQTKPGLGMGERVELPTRNKRSVWSIATQPYAGAHFATMPPELAETCIRAGCPVDGTVLDPFCGSGTTLAVAIANGRNGIGVELNAEYIALAMDRITGTQPALIGW